MVEDIKDSESWAQATRFYDYLKAMENMNNIRSWAQDSRYYK